MTFIVVLFKKHEMMKKIICFCIDAYSSEEASKDCDIGIGGGITVQGIWISMVMSSIIPICDGLVLIVKESRFLKSLSCGSKNAACVVSDDAYLCG